MNMEIQKLFILCLVSLAAARTVRDRHSKHAAVRTDNRESAATEERANYAYGGQGDFGNAHLNSYQSGALARDLYNLKNNLGGGAQEAGLNQQQWEADANNAGRAQQSYNHENGPNGPLNNALHNNEQQWQQDAQNAARALAYNYENGPHGPLNNALQNNEQQWQQDANNAARALAYNYENGPHGALNNAAQNDEQQWQQNAHNAARAQAYNYENGLHGPLNNAVNNNEQQWVQDAHNAARAQAYVENVVASQGPQVIHNNEASTGLHGTYYQSPRIQIAQRGHEGPNVHYETEEQYAPAHYHFNYGVHDVGTGDIKEQEEERRGEEVRGKYSLVQPDGLKRIVNYSGDQHGFNALVSYEPVHDHHEHVPAQHEAPSHS